MKSFQSSRAKYHYGVLFFYFLLSLGNKDGLCSESIKLEYLGKIQEPAWAWGSEARIYINNDKLFIPLGYPGLAIYDISNPQTPQLLKILDNTELGGQAGAVAVQGNYAYVATPDKGTIIKVDISNPSGATVAEQFGEIPNILQLAIRGQFLYAHAQSSIAYAGGVYVFDISKDKTVSAGQYLKNLIDPGFFVTSTGGVFLARTPEYSGDSAKIDYIDMSQPASPNHLGQWLSSYPGNICDIYLRGNRLYCASYWGGVWILDASDFSNLKLEALFDWDDPASYSKSIQTFPPYIFVAEGGPILAYQKFEVFRQIDNRIILEQEIPASTYTDSVYLYKDLLIRVEIESPWQVSWPNKILYFYRIDIGLKPPINVYLQRTINRSLFREEAFHTLRWTANPDNSAYQIKEYRIYRKYLENDDQSYQLIGTVPGNIYEYVDGYLDVSKKFMYAITSLESEGLESLYSVPAGN